MRVELPIVSFISTLLVLIPLPWHWRTRNVCTASIFLWLAVSNIETGINTIIWGDNVDVKYKIWCDIAVKIQVSSNIGVPASVACICRRLAHACSPYHGMLDVEGKRQRTRFEIGMCVVLPFIAMVLHVIVQIYRFQLNEGFGCYMVHSRSFPTLLIIGIPPLLMSMVSMVYAGIALRWLIHRRAQFLQLTPYAEPVPASGRYIRAVALAVTQMTAAMVMSLILLSALIENGVSPWTSWEYIHENWREINIVHKGAAHEWMEARFMATWYFVPLTSVIVFAYFGPGADDRIVAECKNMFNWIRVHIFRIRFEKDAGIPLSRVEAAPSESIPKPHSVITDVIRTDDLSTLHSSTHI